MDLVDLIDLEVSEPTCFYTWGGEAWYRGRISPLTRNGNTLRFEYFDSEADDWEDPTIMALEEDGLYHFRDGKERRWAFVAETKAHVHLIGNFINDDGAQGVELWVWPQDNVRTASPEQKTATVKNVAAKRSVNRK